MLFQRYQGEINSILHHFFYNIKIAFSVCPAGWKPGAKTMKPDPKGSKEYFKSSN